LRRAEWEICRVYVDPAQHGSGLGHGLLDIAEGHAVAAGAQRLVLWSDTRFERAHRFYEKRGYARLADVRVLDDISNSREFGFAKAIYRGGG
jgi:GNAT superfamily N-acetyltransferase